MRRTETLKTEQFSYECTQLGAIEGRTALLRAQKIAVQGVNGLDAMVNAMTPNDLDYFCALFSKQTRVQIDSKRPLLSDVFDLHFAGDMAFEMVEWLAFCLGLNFGVFFQKIQSQGEKIKAAALAGTGQPQPSDPEQSESPNP